MKKISRLSCVAIVCAMVLGSCSSEDMETGNATGQNRFTIVATLGDEAGTRTALDENGVSVNWVNGDAISVISAATLKNEPFELVSGAGSKTGYFEGTASVSEGLHVAIYPYSKDYAISGATNGADGAVSGCTISNGVIPATQMPVKNGFDPKSNLMTAMSSNDKLYFRQAICYVEVETTVPCTSIVFSTNGTENLAGVVDMSVGNDGIASCSVKGSGVKKVTLANSDGSAFEPGVYHIAIKPGDLESGFTVECYKPDYMKLVRTYNKKTAIFGRDKIVSLGKTQGWEEHKAHECSHYYEYGAGCKEMVDLGLPSGLKWAKCNLGAMTEYEFGDYYMWAAVEPSAFSYDISKENPMNKYFTLNPVYNDYIPELSCKWNPNPALNSYNKIPYCVDGKFTKYCANDPSQQAPGANADDLAKTHLDLIDDAARHQWGDHWRIPDSEEWRELLDNSTNSVIDDYNGTKIKVWKLTSKINGNFIIIPIAGHMHQGPGTSAPWINNDEMYYWASEYCWNTPGVTNMLGDQANRMSPNYGGWPNLAFQLTNKGHGLPVRAIYDVNR